MHFTKFWQNCFCSTFCLEPNFDMSWKSLDFSLSHCCENHIFCIWTWVHSQDKCDSNILKNIASIELAGVGYSREIREGPIPWLRFFACVSPPFVPMFQYYIRLLGRGKIGSLRNPLTISAPPKKTHNIRIIVATCSASFFRDMKDHKIKYSVVIADGVTGDIQRCASAWSQQ